MNPMSTAGSPAPASSAGPLPQSPLSAGDSEPYDAAPRTPARDDDPLVAFLADAAARRDSHTRQEIGRPEDWADPDPAPAAYRHAGSHPVDRAANKHRLGDSRNDFLRRVRVACEGLQGLEPRTLTPEQVRAFPWHHIDQDTAREYREDIYRRYRYQTTRNDAVSVLRRVMLQCYRAGLISALRLELVLEELYTVAPGPSTKRRRLTQPEINALLAACEDTGTGRAAARNTAIVALFRTSGIRIGELTRIQLEDWDRDAGTIVLHETKNGTPHIVYLHPDAVPYLERWVTHRGEAPGALFCPLTGTDLRSLTMETVRYMLKTRAAIAGVKPFGSHDFRRTFATELLRTTDIALVGKLLNHHKVQSTLRYDLAGEEEARGAVAQLDLPTMRKSEDVEVGAGADGVTAA